MNRDIKYIVEDLIEFNPVDYQENEGELDQQTISKIICQPGTKEELVDIIAERLRINPLKPYLNNIDTSNIKDMSNLFSAFEGEPKGELVKLGINSATIEILDISKWNTSNVKDMSGMFMELTNLKQINLSGFDTSKVENMSGMFAGCSSLTEIDISNFTGESLKDISYMFEYCYDLEELHADNLIPIPDIDIEGVFGDVPLNKLPKWFDMLMSQKY